MQSDKRRKRIEYFFFKYGKLLRDEKIFFLHPFVPKYKIGDIKMAYYIPKNIQLKNNVKESNVVGIFIKVLRTYKLFN